MPDIVRRANKLFTDIFTRFVDMGDGSHAEVVLSRIRPPTFNAPANVASAAVIETLTLNGRNRYTVDIVSPGTSCTLVVEGSIDGTTWKAISGLNLAGTSSTTLVASATTAVQLRFDVEGLQAVRTRVSVYGSGTVTTRSSLS